MADGPSSLANALTSGTIGWVRSDMVLCLVFLLALDLGLCELIIFNLSRLYNQYLRVLV
jgi:hypothetical protein